jgi:hypothetical protein
MDPYVYESYTVPTSYVVSTPVTKMDYSHITFVAYLFSTIFSTSTTTPQMSTVAQTEIRIPRTNPVYTKKYYPTTTSSWIRPKWYHEHDYWRNIVSKELSFHEKSKTTTTSLQFSTIENKSPFSDLFARQFLPPRCCPKKTTTTASVSILLVEKSTEINLAMQNEGFGVAQICILIVLCLILFILLGFVVRIVLRARVKQKINIRSKEACEMSSFTTRMRRHVKDSVQDFDVTTDLLECTRDSRKDNNKFEDVSLISKNSLANENFSTKFTTTVDIHPQVNI